MMLSQTHGRLGDPREAERIATDCVQTAETLDDQMVLALALNRLAITVERDAPERAQEIYRRALKIFETVGDVRGQAGCHNNLGNIAATRNAWQEARHSYDKAITLARSAGMPELWGTAASNLGVIYQRTGDFERARELLGEALALVAAVKNSEIQLYALYNMAHLEWENRAWDSGAELYEATASLAKRIGADDVEIGSLAGGGLCCAEAGRVDAARRAYGEIEDRVRRRPDWFQGREFVEALAVALLVLDGRIEEAVSRFESAVPKAETSDLYTAAWLTAVCARTLFPYAPDRVRSWIERYASHVDGSGYADISKQLNVLLAR
jgi:tetratricopeptide (TPR) repeat protein